MGPFLRKYGTTLDATTAGSIKVRICLRKAGSADFAINTDWDPAAGDVKISKDGGARANIGTLPSYSNGQWEFILADTELECKFVNVFIVDSATKAVDDEWFCVETTGHTSAMWPTNYSGGAAGNPITSGTGTDQLSVSSGQVLLQSGTNTGMLDIATGRVKIQPGTNTGQIDIVAGAVNFNRISGITLPTATAPDTTIAAWAEGQGYSENDIRSDNGRVYICIDAHTSTATHPASLPLLWTDAGPVGQVLKSAGTLAVGSVVLVKGADNSVGGTWVYSYGTGYYFLNDSPSADLSGCTYVEIPGRAFYPPTAAQNASATRTELGTELGRIDATISSRLPATGGTVASVSGAVGSVTGAVGSVTGNVGGNVAGSVGSVTGAVGSVTGNIGGNVAGSVASVTGAVGSVTGNIGGNVAGSVASVTGAVGSVTGAVVVTNGTNSGQVPQVTDFPGGDATAANQTTIIGHLTDIKGASFTTGDDLHSLAGQVEALSPSSGEGAYSIVVTVTDGTDPLQNAAVRYTEGATSILLLTDANGQATFNLDEATWTVSISKSGYTFAQTTHAVSASGTASYAMAAVSIPAPATPDETTGYLTCYDVNNDPVGSVNFEFELLYTSGTAGRSYPRGEVVTVSSGTNGLVSIGLLKSATYRVRRAVGTGWTEWFQITSGTNTTTAIPELPLT